MSSDQRITYCFLVINYGIASLYYRRVSSGTSGLAVVSMHWHNPLRTRFMAVRMESSRSPPVTIILKIGRILMGV